MECESERRALIEATQRLVHIVQTPEEAVRNNAFSVGLPISSPAYMLILSLSQHTMLVFVSPLTWTSFEFCLLQGEAPLPT